MVEIVRVCVEHDTHTFQCCPSEGSLFLFFGVEGKEYIFEHFSMEEIKSLRDACECVIDIDETEKEGAV